MGTLEALFEGRGLGGKSQLNGDRPTPGWDVLEGDKRFPVF